MSTTIDERVVEMRFDNKEFERGAKDTMNTLDRLKAALDRSDSAKSLENIDAAAKSISLDGIASGVEALQQRFSTFGIIGMRVLENLTDSCINFVKRGINFVDDAIVSGGIRRAMNIENAHFQLQALLKDESKVQEVMDAAMKSVDGTAYAYDEAAKAASQFAASGLQTSEELLPALRGIVGVAAMTNSEYESISRIFTTVAGNGRLMGDQLLQLSSRGLNAASTIAEFMNGVNDGSKEATENVKTLVQSMTDGLAVTEGDIREFVSDGKISFELFSAAMTEAFADSAERANETFTGALSNMKSALARIGAEFISPLVAQNSAVVGLFNALRVRINDIKKALTFDEAIGNTNALSKQFTDSVLSMASALTEFVQNADLTTPIEVFYYGVESIKNVVKALYSVVKPLGQAFSEVFLSFSSNDVTDFAAKIENLTSKMILNEKESGKLRDSFRDLFQGFSDVASLIRDIIRKLTTEVIPLSDVIGALANGLLSLIGFLGRTASAFTDWVRKSPIIAKSYEVLLKVVSLIRTAFDKFSEGLSTFISDVKSLPFVQEIIRKVTKSFSDLGNLSSPYLDKLSTSLSALEEKMNDLDFSNFFNWLKSLIEKIQDFVNMVSGNKSLSSATDNVKQFATNLSDSLSFDNAVDKIDSIKTALGGFVDWIKEHLGPVFSDISFGSVVAGGSGIAMLYSLIKLSGSFGQISKSISSLGETIGKSFSSIGSLFGSVEKTMVAYQKNLNASAIIKIAGAIAILAGALILLSFADTSKIMGASVALSIIAGVLLIGVSKLLEVTRKGKTVNDALYQFATGLSTSMKRLSSAVQIKAIGGAFKDFGIALAAITGSIIAIAMLYKNDSESLMEGLKIIGIVAAVMVGIIALMSMLGKKMESGMKNFSTAALGILGLSLSLTLVVKALQKLFNMELPDDWKPKLGILAGILGGLGILAILIGAASKLSGGGKLSSAPILAVAIVLMVSISSLKKLFEMDLPSDWQKKVGILTGIFAELVVLIMAISLAGRVSGGAIKAAGTILAMCAFIGMAVAALLILSLIPGDKLIKGASALGIVLLSLAGTLAGAGKITNADTYKTVLAMAVAVGSIVVALSVLSMIPLEKLAKSCVALGGMLLVLAVDFKAISKISNTDIWRSIGAMCAAILVISISLVALATQPWDGILSSGVAMSAVLISFGETLKKISALRGLNEKKILLFLEATLSLVPIGAALYALSGQPWGGMLASSVAISTVLLSFAKTLKMISSSSGIKVEKISLFLLATLSLAPIGAALYLLSEQPWEGMLASAAALSAVTLSFAKTLQIISGLRGIKLEKILEFIASTLALVPIGAALYLLSEQPWEGMLAAGTALSGVILAYSTAFSIISAANPNAKAIAAFIAGTVGIGIIAASLYFLSEQPWENLLAAAASVSVVLLAMSAAMGICSLVGAIAPAAIAGMGLLDLFIANFALVLVALGAIFQGETAQAFLSGGAEILSQIGNAIGSFVGNIIGGFLSGITDGLPKIATNLSTFMDNLGPFFDGAKRLDPSIMDSVGSLAKVILILTAADILEGLTSWLTGGSSLSSFGEELASFGPSIAKFASDVSGVNVDSIQGASSAALILAEMASTLPNNGGLAGLIFGENNLSEFGEELESFGPHIAAFAEQVVDVKPEAVKGAAEAAQIMADMASTLPNNGGLAGLIFGENNLSEFGEELEAFGGPISSFAEKVKNVKPEAVQGAAASAQMMADMASTLPNKGGVVSWFTGDNTLSEFGEELTAFGGPISEFAKKVKNVKADAVQGAASAAQMIADVASNLPNKGGVVSWFTGDNTIAEFGEELESFGPHIAAFAEQVKNVDPDAVQGAAEATRILSEIAQGLPNTGGVGSWFTGDNDIGDFGESLEDFGVGIKGFYDQIAQINVTQFGKVIDETKELVDLSKLLEGVKSSSFTTFSKNLQNAGKMGIDEFVNAFTNGKSRALTAVKNFISSVSTTINQSLPSLRSTATTFGNSICTSIQSGIASGQSGVIASVKNLVSMITSTIKSSLTSNTLTSLGSGLIDGLIVGINKKQSAAVSSVRLLSDAIINQLKNGLTTTSAISIGAEIISNLARGLSSNSNQVNAEVKNVCDSILRVFMDILSPDQFAQIGAQAVNGFKNGIESLIGDATSSVKKLANSAIKTLRQVLGIHSPSRVAYSIAQFFDKGFISGLTSMISKVEKASKSVGLAASDKMRNAIATVSGLLSDDIDTNITIRPSIDLTEIQNGANKISSLLAQGIDLSASYDRALSTAGSFAGLVPNNTAYDSTEGKSVQNYYSFEQNNYSPKELSAIDIYRQTKNQLRTFERVVEQND